jgi:hypothetical protein
MESTGSEEKKQQHRLHLLIISRSFHHRRSNAKVSSTTLSEVRSKESSEAETESAANKGGSGVGGLNSWLGCSWRSWGSDRWCRIGRRSDRSGSRSGLNDGSSVGVGLGDNGSGVSVCWWDSSTGWNSWVRSWRSSWGADRWCWWRSNGVLDLTVTDLLDWDSDGLDSESWSAEGGEAEEES